MAPSSLAKKLFRTFARVIPQSGMVSQAVAFNMFLVFFPILLVALGLVSSSLRGKNGQILAVRLSEILPPRQLAARIRIPVAPGSERLAVGVSRLGRNTARGLAGDEA